MLRVALVFRVQVGPPKGPSIEPSWPLVVGIQGMLAGSWGGLGTGFGLWVQSWGFRVAEEQPESTTNEYEISE